MFQKHVTAVASIIDPNTRRQLVRSKIDDPKHLLRSMSAWVTTAVTTGMRQDGGVQTWTGLARARPLPPGAVFLSNKLMLGDAN